MAFSLYDATVANYLQTLGALGGVLERGLAYCQEKSVNPQEFVDCRLAHDMLPLRFQVISACHHSLGAIEGAKAGLFTPPKPNDGLDYPGLQRLVTETITKLQALSREEVNALEGGDVVFQLGERRMPFVTQDFLMSFSLPNFYFHATTAYDLLRIKGVALGKRDFLGRPRIKV
jgi:uncharacterized protein